MNETAVGIDVSKGKSTIAIQQPCGVIVRRPFDVHHNRHELQALADQILGIQGDVKVIMEYTGHYYEPIAHFLKNAGIFTSVINPKLIKDYDNNSLRHVKTDKADAMKIARYGIDKWRLLREYCPMDEKREQLRALNRQFSFYNKQKTAIRNNLISILDQTFPGVNNLFNSPVRKDGHQKWVDFAASFWHADCVRQCSLEAFRERYAKWCSKNGYDCRKGKSEEIYNFTQDLVPTLPKDSTTKYLVTTTVKAMTMASVTLESIRDHMNELASTLPEYPVVMDMAGVGPSLGPQLIAEIGDISKFTRRSEITAFAGVDPGENQSGTHDQKSVHASKAGSPYLRSTLFNIMSVLIKTHPDDPVYRFIEKKRAEGKPFYVCMTAEANKFLRIYYGKVKSYLETQQSQGGELEKE